MELKELISKCKKNKREAQRELFMRYKDVLYYTSLKYCRNKLEAEDNVQDAFISIFDQIKKYNGTGSFEGWMKRIAIFKAIDKFKHQIKNSNELPHNLEEAHEIDVTDTSVSLTDILEAVQELPDQYRIVFTLFQLDHYSHKEIASLLNISEGTSKSNYHRAKGILKRKIEELQKTSKKI